MAPIRPKRCQMGQKSFKNKTPKEMAHLILDFLNFSCMKTKFDHRFIFLSKLFEDKKNHKGTQHRLDMYKIKISRELYH